MHNSQVTTHSKCPGLGAYSSISDVDMFRFYFY